MILDNYYEFVLERMEIGKKQQKNYSLLLRKIRNQR